MVFINHAPECAPACRQTQGATLGNAPMDMAGPRDRSFEAHTASGEMVRYARQQTTWAQVQPGMWHNLDLP